MTNNSEDDAACDSKNKAFCTLLQNKIDLLTGFKKIPACNTKLIDIHVEHCKRNLNFVQERRKLLKHLSSLEEYIMKNGEIPFSASFFQNLPFHSTAEYKMWLQKIDMPVK